MHSLVWQPENNVHRLQLDRLIATIDPGRPQEGLVEVSIGASRLDGAELLGIASASFPSSDERLSVECYVRGPDLMGSYEESAARPVPIDVRWHAASPAPSEKFIAAVELAISVQTQALDSRPLLTVQSRLAASQTLRLFDLDSIAYRPLTPSPGAPILLQPRGGPGCLLFRMAGTKLSYAEMVHPADFQHDELAGTPENNDETVHLSHRLFPQRLEKGVMFRARVRGVFLPREADKRVAAECYAAFAAAEPPLGT